MRNNSPIYHFWAQFSRLRFVQRWSIKYNHTREDSLQHSAEVAAIAHGLACIRNEITGGEPIDANRAGMIALLHDAAESVVGDVITPAKKADPEIEAAWKTIEARAERTLISFLPEQLRPIYRPLVEHDHIPPEYARLVKAADVLAALAKCEKEVSLGNPEFSDALNDIRARLESYSDLPEVQYFLSHCMHSYRMTVDSQLAEALSGAGEHNSGDGE